MGVKVARPAILALAAGFSICFAWSLLSLVGTVLATAGGVQSIRWKRPIA